jgi:hypothetical protein
MSTKFMKSVGGDGVLLLISTPPWQGGKRERGLILGIVVYVLVLILFGCFFGSVFCVTGGSCI